MDIIPLNIFGEMETLEPKCGKCRTILDYGSNTKYDSKLKCHICIKCGNALK